MLETSEVVPPWIVLACSARPRHAEFALGSVRLHWLELSFETNETRSVVVA